MNIASEIVAAMWQVAYADGERSATEDSVIRLTAKLLGVTDRESAVARQDIQQELGRA